MPASRQIRFLGLPLEALVLFDDTVVQCLLTLTKKGSEIAVRYVGAEPSSPWAQLEHLADLLRNRMNSQWNPSLYEVWRPKIVEDIENPMVKRLCWDCKVPGIYTGP